MNCGMACGEALTIDWAAAVQIEPRAPSVCSHLGGTNALCYVVGGYLQAFPLLSVNDGS